MVNFKILKDSNISEKQKDTAILTFKKDNKTNLKMSLELLKQITLLEAKSELDRFKLDIENELLNKTNSIAINIENKLDETINQKLLYKIEMLKEALKAIETNFESQLEIIKNNFLEEIKLRVKDISYRFTDHINDLCEQTLVKLEQKIKEELEELITLKG